jgi:sulfotransferase family protein
MTESFSGRYLREAAKSRRRRRLAGTILRTSSPVLPRKGPPDEPIFILGSPRSGSTLLFEVLGRSPRLASLERESHLLWEMFHDLEAAKWGSHEVGPQDITKRERRVLYWAIDRVSMGRRYLDKAPRNCLRVPYLAALFPGAWFVHLKRDGRAAVSSLITGWRSPGDMFPGATMPRPLSISGYQGDTWKFLVPPGWETYATGRSLEEVCAFQWISANESILQSREQLGTERWVEVTYEDFVEAPTEQTARLLDRLGLGSDPDVLEHASSLDRHVTKAVTPPRPDKWRTENPQEIERIVPMIEPMMRRLGYGMEDSARSS